MKGPWYISVAAVRDYLWIMRRPDAIEGDGFERAERELIEMAERVVAGEQDGRPLDSGAIRYRGPRPRRLALIVGDGEGDRPALIAVLPGVDDGRGRGPHRRE